MLNKKLIAFSASAVLLNNPISALHAILTDLGKQKEVDEIRDQYNKRRHTGPWGLEETAKLYAGVSRAELYDRGRKFCEKFLMLGAKECIDELKKDRWIVVGMSSNPHFVTDALKELLMLDHAYGLELEYNDQGIATGKIVRNIDRYGKADILQQLMKENALTNEEVVVVGDSLTDIPMAEKAGYIVAFNAQKEMKEVADTIIEEKNLLNALQPIRAYDQAH